MRLSFVMSIAFTVLAVGCGDGGGSADCHHSCPIDDFAVFVPADRVDDVASVTSEGPCTSESVTGSAPGIYFFSVTATGVCRVTIAFLSGAPDFVGSMSIVPNAGPCCVGQATAQSGSIAVPELGQADH